MKEPFKIIAKGEKMNLHIDVEVETTEDYMPNRINATKNVIFDMLRSQDFDVDKIVIE